MTKKTGFAFALAVMGGLAATSAYAGNSNTFMAFFQGQPAQEEAYQGYYDANGNYYGANAYDRNDPAYAAYYNNGYQADPRGADEQLRGQAATATRELVEDPTGQRPGTITVDTPNRYLYLSLPNRQAIRYGIGVGRDGFRWKGLTHIGRKESWPDWTPPAAMLKRRPDLPRHMEGGEDNPLGARAMYLYSGSRDTMFRIHGSNEPWTIGQAVSSGCIRMLNDDVTDLFSRVRIGTTVVVL
jgi:lipoprotein-anchoring transpeptidase ErfK/SrfK